MPADLVSASNLQHILELRQIINDFVRRLDLLLNYRLLERDHRVETVFRREPFFGRQFSGSPNECGASSTSGFAMMIGGGVDAKMTKRFGFRMVQIDWARLASEFGAQNSNVRVSTGRVVRF